MSNLSDLTKNIKHFSELDLEKYADEVNHFSQKRRQKNSHMINKSKHKFTSHSVDYFSEDFYGNFGTDMRYDKTNEKDYYFEDSD